MIILHEERCKMKRGDDENFGGKFWNEVDIKNLQYEVLTRGVMDVNAMT